jgi:hypothetical protein
MFLDSIVRLFYVLSRFNTFIMAMIRSAGCIELIAKCWALEDIPGQSIILGPIPTTTLGTVVKCAAALGKHDVYERVIRAAGGDANSIVQLLLGRVKKAAKTFNPDLGALGLSWHIDLLVELCQPCPHALRRGFFDAGVIAIVTSAFVALSRTIDQNPTPDSVSLMVSCFKFFSRYLEGDDYPSLVHVVKAGFLAAFLDCSSAFHRMPKESQEAALYIVRRVLPPYLVYRSFIEAVKNATDRLRTPHYQALLAQPVIAEALRPFITLLAKRTPHVEYMHKLESEEIPAQSEGAPAECDYTKVCIILRYAVLCSCYPSVGVLTSRTPSCDAQLVTSSRIVPSSAKSSRGSRRTASPANSSSTAQRQTAPSFTVCRSRKGTSISPFSMTWRRSSSPTYHTRT